MKRIISIQNREGTVSNERNAESEVRLDKMWQYLVDYVTRFL